MRKGERVTAVFVNKKRIPYRLAGGSIRRRNIRQSPRDERHAFCPDKEGPNQLSVRTHCFLPQAPEAGPFRGLFLESARIKAVNLRHTKNRTGPEQRIHRRRSRSICRNSGRADSHCRVRLDMKS